MSIHAAQDERDLPLAQPERAEPVASPASVKELRSGFGLSREKFGRLTGFSVRALAGWESGTQKPGEQARLRLTEMVRLLAGLSKVIRPAAVAEWFDAPNPAFEGLKPLEVVERGQIDRLWRMIFYLESGVAS